MGRTVTKKNDFLKPRKQLTLLDERQSLNELRVSGKTAGDLRKPTRQRFVFISIRRNKSRKVKNGFEIVDNGRLTNIENLLHVFQKLFAAVQQCCQQLKSEICLQLLGS